MTVLTQVSDTSATRSYRLRGTAGDESRKSHSPQQSSPVWIEPTMIRTRRDDVSWWQRSRKPLCSQSQERDARLLQVCNASRIAATVGTARGSNARTLARHAELGRLPRRETLCFADSVARSTVSHPISPNPHPATPSAFISAWRAECQIRGQMNCLKGDLSLVVHATRMQAEPRPSSCSCTWLALARQGCCVGHNHSATVGAAVRCSGFPRAGRHGPPEGRP